MAIDSTNGYTVVGDLTVGSAWVYGSNGVQTRVAAIALGDDIKIYMDPPHVEIRPGLEMSEAAQKFWEFVTKLAEKQTSEYAILAALRQLEEQVKVMAIQMRQMANRPSATAA